MNEQPTVTKVIINQRNGKEKSRSVVLSNGNVIKISTQATKAYGAYTFETSWDYYEKINGKFVYNLDPDKTEKFGNWSKKYKQAPHEIRQV